MIHRKIKAAIFAGVISGFFLGVFLKVIEYSTGLRVYTLLLNIDYIPIINRIKFPEIIEFGNHLIISIFVSIFLMMFLATKHWASRCQLIFVVVVSLMIGFLLFPTTALSIRTPALSDYSALFYWLLGHGLYGLLLGYLLNKKLNVYHS